MYDEIGLVPWTTKCDIEWKNLVIEDTCLGKGKFTEVRAGGVRARGQVTKSAVKILKGKMLASYNILVIME